MERWKFIDGYEGYYEVSDHGRVRSVDRIDCAGHRLKGKILKPVLGGNGYYNVGLHKDGKQKTHMIHRLVALAFCGGFSEGLDVCHNDGNPLNNHHTNLRWDTRKGNLADKAKHGTLARGQRHSISKLTDDQVLEIRRLYATGDYTQTKLAEMFDVAYTTIGNIVRRETWKHI